MAADGTTDPRLAELQREWDELAEADAMWAVLTDRTRKGGRWSVDDFLASGEEEIAAALDRVARLGRPARRERALDFGCGVGRLSHALASRFDAVVGVDVSDEMVRRAQTLNADLPNVEFVVNGRPDLRLFDSGSFDLTYSNIVLQHLPTAELVTTFVRELMRVTARDGVAIFQAPSAIPARYRLQPLRRGYTALRRLGIPAKVLILRSPLQPMRMTAVPRPAIERAVSGSHAELLAVESDGAFGFRYVTSGSDSGA